MRFFPLSQACFGSTLSNEHLLEALRGKEPFYHGGFTVEHIATPENFLGGTRAAYERELGSVQWLELPGYPISDVPLTDVPEEELDSYFVRGMVANWERDTIALEQFSALTDHYYVVDREVWSSDGGKGGLRVRVIVLTSNLRSELAVRIDVDGSTATIVREQWERYSAENDDQTSLCLEAYKLMARFDRLKKMRRIDAPEEIVEDVQRVIGRSRESLQALRPDLSVPDPEEAGWDSKMRGYLSAAGLGLSVADDLMEGRFPRKQGIISTWVTQAVLTQKGDFSVVHNDVQQSNLPVPRVFPLAPTQKGDEMKAYHAELRAALELSVKSIADLPRIVRLAKRYNVKLKFD